MINTQLVEETAEEFEARANLEKSDLAEFDDLLPKLKRLQERIMAEFPAVDETSIFLYVGNSLFDFNCRIKSTGESIAAGSATELIEQIRAYDPQKRKLREIADLESKLSKLKAEAKLVVGQ